MIEIMDIMEQVYDGKTPSKITTNRANANRARYYSKLKGGKSTFLTNWEKGRADKFKKNHAGNLSDCPNSDKSMLYAWHLTLPGGV